MSSPLRSSSRRYSLPLSGNDIRCSVLIHLLPHSLQLSLPRSLGFVLLLPDSRNLLSARIQTSRLSSHCSHSHFLRTLPIPNSHCPHIVSQSPAPLSTSQTWSLDLLLSRRYSSPPFGNDKRCSVLIHLLLHSLPLPLSRSEDFVLRSPDCRNLLSARIQTSPLWSHYSRPHSPQTLPIPSSHCPHIVSQSTVPLYPL